MEIAGYFAAVLIGVSLGLIGSGGSILTVPALVYLMGISPLVATSYSLFIVGATSLVGGLQKLNQGSVNIRAALIFGIPSIVAVFLTRMFIIPALPDVMFSVGTLVITNNLFVLLLFAVLMILASFSMIYQKKIVSSTSEVLLPRYNYPMIFLEGSVVGVLTGLVGAGGGFLIIPALVLLTKLPMKMAVGTSLLIIAAKSLIGFTGDLAHMPLDWTILLTFTGLAITGIFIGNKLSHGIENNKLKKAFGWFILVMGIYIILKELI